MSRRRRHPSPRPTPRPEPTPEPGWAKGAGRGLPDVRSVRERLARASVLAAALLPLRLFLGVTFLYAGLDKLLDPAFLDASSSASIQDQLAAFVRFSPIADLIRVAEPLAVPIGLVIAIGEIAVGLGALTGLAFRVAAAGGVALSVLFWLTASWATHPYYYGPDLPYAFGWVTLALAGTGGLLIPSRLRPASEPGPTAAAGRRLSTTGQAIDRSAPTLDRRMVLQASLLGVAAVAVASLAVPLRLMGVEMPGGHPTETPAGSPTGSIGTGQSDAPNPPGTPPPSGISISTIAAVTAHGTASFEVPFDAPAPLPAGDPGIIVQLADGTFVAYDAVCTHEGCTVEWDAADAVIICPCHGAAFDAADHAAVLAGPTNQPLSSLPLVVDPTTGQIFLKT